MLKNRITNIEPKDGQPMDTMLDPSRHWIEKLLEGMNTSLNMVDNFVDTLPSICKSPKDAPKCPKCKGMELRDELESLLNSYICKINS